MSLRGRLLVVIGIIFVLGLVAADFATYSALESFLYGRVDQQLDHSAGNLIKALNQGGSLPPDFCAGPGPFSPEPEGAHNQPGFPGPGQAPQSSTYQEQAVQVLTSSGKVFNHQSCPAYIEGSPYLPAIPASIEPAAVDGGVKVTYLNAPALNDDGPEFRVQETVLNNGNRLVVAQPLGDTSSTLHHLLLVELLVTLLAILAALASAIWLVRIGLRPLVSIEATAEAIADGDLSRRVSGENHSTEIGRLAGTFNKMLGRIESAFNIRLMSEQRLRRFVADASHELRTPVAAISAYSELFDRGASENREDLDRLLAGIRRESKRMGVLVNDLLLLTRLEEERAVTAHPVDLVALCAEATHVSTTVGPEWPATVLATHPIEIWGDEHGLRQVLDNLLANVRSHTPAGTSVQVLVGSDAAGAVIVVQDDGPGMNPEQAAQIFERFYRTDPSRSRALGGSGLGLSIVDAIVTNHGGTVIAESSVGHGLTITVHLPKNVDPPTSGTLAQ